MVIFCVVVKRNIITVPNYPKRRERKIIDLLYDIYRCRYEKKKK